MVKKTSPISDLTDKEINKFLESKSAEIANFAKERGFSGILMIAGSKPQNIAAPLLANYLKDLDIPLNLLFMPDMKTNTVVYDFYSELCGIFNIKFKILPVKFLQSLYKNTYREHFSSEFLAETERTIAGIRQTIVSSLIQDKNFLLIDTSSKTDFILSNPPINICISNTICPFGGLMLSHVFDLIGSSLPESLKNNFNVLLEASEEHLPDRELDKQIQDVLKSKTPLEKLKELQTNKAFLDKAGPINEYSILTNFDYYPVLK